MRGGEGEKEERERERREREGREEDERRRERNTSYRKGSKEGVGWGENGESETEKEIGSIVGRGRKIRRVGDVNHNKLRKRWKEVR